MNNRHHMGSNGIDKIHGQEKNIPTYKSARVNMLLHGVKDNQFGILHALLGIPGNGWHCHNWS